jgi:hypothetical protein
MPGPSGQVRPLQDVLFRRLTLLKHFVPCAAVFSGHDPQAPQIFGNQPISLALFLRQIGLLLAKRPESEQRG